MTEHEKQLRELKPEHQAPRGWVRELSAKVWARKITVIAILAAPAILLHILLR